MTDRGGTGNHFDLPAFNAFGATTDGQEFDAASREVLAEFGIAMISGQTLEALCKLIAPAQFIATDDEAAAAKRFLESQSASFYVGIQALEVVPVTGLSSDLIGRLHAARGVRNHLAHSWFWDGGMRMVGGEHEAVLAELQETAALFYGLYQELLTTVFSTAFTSLGIAPDVLGRALDAATVASVQDPSVLAGLSIPDDGAEWMQRVHDSVTGAVPVAPSGEAPDA